MSRKSLLELLLGNSTWWWFIHKTGRGTPNEGGRERRSWERERGRGYGSGRRLLLSLETVNLDTGLLTNALVDEELGDVGSLIALELDHLTKLGIIDNGTVAAELL